MDATNTKVVNVELYSEIMKDTTYNFTYGEKTVSLIGVDPNAVANIIITTSTAVSEEETEIKVNFLDANGVIINGNMDYVTFSAPDSVDYFLYDKKIYFNAIGKEAVVTATYDRGYDEKGNELPKLTTSKKIVSVASSSANNMLGWAIDVQNKTASDLSYSTGEINISVDDNNRQLYGKYNITLANGSEQARYTCSAGAGQTEDGAQFEYTSTNDAVIMVDMYAGILHPASVGKAQIIVKRVYGETNKPVVGVCTVNVVSSRALTNFTVQPNKTKLAVGTSGASDEIQAIVSPTDQLGGTVETDVTYTVKVVSSLPNGVSINLEGNGGTVTLSNTNKEETLSVKTGINGWQRGYIITANAPADNKITNVQLSITASKWGKVITRPVSFQVKNVTGSEIATYSLDLGRSEIEMNIPSFGNNDGMWRFESSIELRGYDNQGFYKALLSMTPNTDTPAKDAYGYTVYKGQENKYNMVDNNIFKAVTVKTVTGSGITSGSSIEVIDKNNGWNVGTYTVKVYQGVEVSGTVKGRVIAFKNIVVKDSTVKPTAVVNNTSITATGDGILIPELTDRITFVRNGSNITDKITILSLAGSATRQEADRIYVDKLRVRELITTGNREVNGKYEEYEVFVGKVFYVR